MDFETMTKKVFDRKTINRLGMMGRVVDKCRCGGDQHLLSESAAQIYVVYCKTCSVMQTEYREVTDKKPRYPSPAPLTKFEKINNRALRKKRHKHSIPRKLLIEDEKEVIIQTR